ncbi:MAG: hypothetical protein IPN96_19140 [Anaerolineales bacterium]|nr:hypothetical protein [Anaerolineales bacterium]
MGFYAIYLSYGINIVYWNVYIITTSISGNESLRLYSDKRLVDMKNDLLTSSWWKKISQSIPYNIAYYSLFLPVVAMAILPLQTISLLFKKFPFKEAFSIEKEKFEQLYVPKNLKNQEITELQRIGRSMSLAYYKSLFPNLYSEKTIVLSTFLLPYFSSIYLGNLLLLALR